MGVVYKATQLDLRRGVVIKVLAPDWIGDPEALARFEREARGLSSLQHPNIVTLHDFGRVDGRAYIVMEYVDGETLNRFVRRKKVLTLAEFVPVAAQVLKGLGEAHSRGIVHRDIKPANIMLCERQGRANYVKILDFGLAKLVSGSSDITKQNVLGTPTCLSPEQIQGQRADQRVDVYAVGILFYFMLSGKLPFEADNDASVLYKHVHEQPEPLEGLLPEDHEVPKGVIELIERCLEKKPDRRPRDANEVVEGLIDQVPFSMFRLPRAEPKPETAPEFIEEEPSSQRSEKVVPVDQIQVGSFPRSSASSTGPVSPSGVVLPKSTIDGLKSQGYSIESSNIYKDSDGRIVIQTTDPNQEADSRAKSTRRMAIGLLLVFAAFLLLVMLNRISNKQPDGSGTPEVASGLSEDPNTVLKQIDELIEDQQFTRARSSLEAKRTMFEHDDLFLGRYEAKMRQIDIKQRLSQARALEHANQPDKAIAKYTEVIELNPNHIEAHERLSALRSKIDADRPAELHINTSPQGADVYIDYNHINKSPFTHLVSPGKHKISVSKEGYQTHETEIEVAPGEKREVEVPRLTKERAAVPVRRPEPEEFEEPEVKPQPTAKKKKPRPRPPQTTPTTKKKKKPSGGLLPT
ncbi:MAG: protein kinase [Myxococcales bacterium]|nr:protein kinase [Myxococcales bacterium]